MCVASLTPRCQKNYDSLIYSLLIISAVDVRLHLSFMKFVFRFYHKIDKKIHSSCFLLSVFYLPFFLELFPRKLGTQTLHTLNEAQAV